MFYQPAEDARCVFIANDTVPQCGCNVMIDEASVRQQIAIGIDLLSIDAPNDVHKFGRVAS